ncbi:MAG: epoxide hydrolase [Burkholderiales bacterium]|nr:epoxide hydrolase [Anaerolineae bacterium]
MKVQPFRIDVPQEVLNDVQVRLNQTRWPDEVEGAAWEYGTNLAYLKELTHYWQHTFDWRTQEALLNQFPHFRAELDGFGIHFIHERGKGPNPKPLLLLHGWPDSFYRFYKIIPMLTDPARFGGDPANSFDVIVPSLPGFGFSDRPRNHGGVDMPGLFARLMTDVLGYSRFGVQGGDGGSPIAQQIASRYPESVIGIHLTDIGWDTASSFDPATLSPAEKAYFEGLEQWSFEEGGYIMIQGTRPQTLAYGLNDSPVGLAAWIVEKFRAWSDSEGEVERRFTKDELLTNIMIYWVTETINSSIRGYYDGMHAEWGSAASARVESPVAVALFPKDNPPPRELAERSLNVQRWTEMPRGGHFAALEEPELLAEDLRTFFQQLR